MPEHPSPVQGALKRGESTVKSIKQSWTRILATALLLALTLACGFAGATTGHRCYSTYPGCAATVESSRIYLAAEAAATAQK